MIVNRHEAMRIVGAMFGCFLLLAGCARGRGTPLSFSGERARGLVAEQVAFGPRPPGSVALARTREWIAATLGGSGWQSRRQAFDYRGVELVNVIGSSGAAGPLIILGAHYDTRPVADHDAEAPAAPVLGAIDGGSGVAVLLELAHVTAPFGGSCRLELVFFDGEDSGGLNDWDWIVGSTHYAASLTEEPSAVVVVDMVGDQSLRLPRELNSDPTLQAEIWGVARDLGYQGSFVDVDGYSMLDDHSPFLSRGWPAVDIIDFDYPGWHTTGDTLDQVSADNLKIVGGTLQEWLRRRCG